MVGALACVVLAGCNGPANSAAALPPGVRVEVYQTRSDVADRAIEISISNASSSTFVVQAASLSTSQFVEPARWQPTHGEVEFAPGRTIDLRALLPLPSCEEPPQVGAVTIDFTVDGTAGSASIPIVDRFDRLPVMRAEECLLDSLSQIAALDFVTPVRTEVRGSTVVGLVDLLLAPTGSAGTWTMDSVEDTVLLGLADLKGREVDQLVLDTTVEADGPPVTVTVPIVPHRCDPHAVAEDKQGTIFTFHVTTREASGVTFRLPTSPEVRSEIYAYVQRACTTD